MQVVVVTALVKNWAGVVMVVALVEVVFELVVVGVSSLAILLLSPSSLFFMMGLQQLGSSQGFSQKTSQALSIPMLTGAVA